MEAPKMASGSLSKLPKVTQKAAQERAQDRWKKRCKRCRRKQPLKNFWVNRKAATGRLDTCTKCMVKKIAEGKSEKQKARVASTRDDIALGLANQALRLANRPSKRVKEGPGTKFSVRAYVAKFIADLRARGIRLTGLQWDQNSGHTKIVFTVEEEFDS